MNHCRLSCLLVLAILSMANCMRIRPQPNVVTGRREHSGFLWIWLDPDADFKQCVRPFTNFQSIVLKVSRNQSDIRKSILAGVGFGTRMYSELSKKALSFEYVKRDGNIGSFPASGGDIFVHAKSNKQSKLVELNQRILATIPDECLGRYEDHYSYIFMGCRDMTGFIDGTMNPRSVERKEVALDSNTGGSFAVAQRWVHNLKEIADLDKETKEGFVGRKLSNGAELQNKLSCSHVAKMTGGTAFQNTPKFKIWRQAQAYGTLDGPAGLFFLGFANSTSNFDFMLDAMVGKDGSGEDDCIFHMTKCVSGNYFYFPGAGELLEMKNKCFL